MNRNHNSIDPRWHPLVDSVNDALEDYPHVPRVQISRFELERVLFGRYGAENPEAWAGVKHLTGCGNISLPSHPK